MSKVTLSLEEAKKIIKEFYESEGFADVIKIDEIEIIFPAVDKNPPIEPDPNLMSKRF